MVLTLDFSSHIGYPRINIVFTGVILEPSTNTATSPSTAKSDGLNDGVNAYKAVKPRSTLLKVSITIVLIFISMVISLNYGTMVVTLVFSSHNGDPTLNNLRSVFFFFFFFFCVCVCGCVRVRGGGRGVKI